jgi:tRNA (guanine6-N2)-methyltransferase
MKHKPKKPYAPTSGSSRPTANVGKKYNRGAALAGTQKAKPRELTAPQGSSKLSALEVEFLPGLERFVQKELESFGCFNITQRNNETFRCEYSGDVTKLFTLRRAIAVYVVHTFAIPRPKALLGDEHLRRLLKAIEDVKALNQKVRFKSFRISAAGQDSSVFQKLIETLQQRLGLPFNEEGDLLLIIRPTAKGALTQGWEVAVRLTPRPLSARPWRVCNIAGGLNATLAAVMNALAAIGPTERYLNAMCGSGTLLIEAGKTARALGIDISPNALACASQNLAAANIQAELLEADITQLTQNLSFEVITADLPWGDAVGTHEGNATLYPAFLDQIAGVATPNARLVLLTHDIKLFESCVAASPWQVIEQYRVYHGGHYPRIYLLKRR